MGYEIGDLVIGKSPFSGDVFIGTYWDSGEEGRTYLTLTEDQHGFPKGWHIIVLTDSLGYAGGEKEPESTPRRELLLEADRLIHGDRNASYGEPTQNFKDTAELWNTQFAHKLKEPLTSTDVALALIQLKLARIKASPKKDNWADLVGYAACGFECDVAEGRIDQ